MFCGSGCYVWFISLFWPFSTDISAFCESHWILYPLKSVLFKDCAKVDSHELVNPYHEFTISFGKDVGCWNGEVSQVKYSC